MDTGITRRAEAFDATLTPMPTILSHAIAGAALGSVVCPRWRVVCAAALCAMLPDADAVGLHLGIPYGSVIGHRGLSHSLAFALVIGLAGGWIVTRGRAKTSLPRTSLALVLATVSHTLLDMLTNGGKGVALLLPFSPSRVFFPWRPIQVAPLSLSRAFSPAILHVLGSELVYVVVPSLALLMITHWLSRRTATARGPASPGATTFSSPVRESSAADARSASGSEARPRSTRAPRDRRRS